MIDGSKLTVKCGNPKCGKEYPVRIGALATVACQGCGSTLVTLLPQVITKGVESLPEVTPMPDDGEPMYTTTKTEEPKKRGRKPSRK